MRGDNYLLSVALTSGLQDNNEKSLISRKVIKSLVWRQSTFTLRAERFFWGFNHCLLLQHGLKIRFYRLGFFFFYLYLIFPVRKFIFQAFPSTGNRRDSTSISCSEVTKRTQNDPVAWIINFVC